jgi:hypothetical protein
VGREVEVGSGRSVGGIGDGVGYGVSIIGCDVAVEAGFDIVLLGDVSARSPLVRRDDVPQPPSDKRSVKPMQTTWQI